jgi:hypothetical protein
MDVPVEDDSDIKISVCPSIIQSISKSSDSANTKFVKKIGSKNIRKIKRTNNIQFLKI